MATITDHDELRSWLDGKPAEWVRVIAVRASLRLPPLETVPDSHPKLTLSVFRALLVSWAATMWPRPGMNPFASASANAVRGSVASILNSVSEDVSNHTAKSASIRAAAYVTVDDAIVDAARAVSDYADFYTHAFRPGSTSGLWEELQHDVETLEAGGRDIDVSSTLIRTRLWSIPGTNREIDRLWRGTKTTLLARSDEHWAPWIEWYDRCLNGEAILFEGLTVRGAKAFSLSLASEKEGFWNRPVAIVNAEVEERLAEARRSRRGSRAGLDRDENGELLAEAPEIPASRPASLEPEWDGGVLGMPREAAFHDPGTHLPQALIALKDDLLELAGDLVGDNRIDRQVQVFLKRLGERLPLTEPTQYELHRIGVAESGLASFVQSEEFQEWPNFFASRLLGVQLQFDRVLRQFPSWRQFKRNADLEEISIEEIRQTADSSERLAQAFESEAQDQVDPALVDALREEADELNVLTADGILHSLVMRAIDTREGLRNTFKRIASRALEEFGDGFHEEARKIPSRAGKSAVTLFVLAVRAVVGVAVAGAIGMPLPELIRFVGANPWVVLLIAGGDGWLKSTLELFAKQQKGKE